MLTACNMKTIGIDINDVIRDNIAQFVGVYKKFIDVNSNVKNEDMTSFDFSEVLEFETNKDYNDFRYIDYAYELYGRAEAVDKMLPYRLNDWLQNTLRDLDEENIPHVLYFSPFEMGLTIQATMAFLSKISTRVREIDFPIDSYKMWEKCDIIITANPNLIKSCPEGKTAIKIERPYNTETECEYTFDSLMSLINDKNETIIKLLEN